MPDILDYSPNVKVETEGNFVGTGDPKLHNLNNINNDDYNQKLSTAQSMSVGAYELANFIPNDCGQKKARDMIRKKFYPKYDEMGREGKAKVNQMVSLKHGPKISKIAKKLLPTIKIQSRELVKRTRELAKSNPDA